ncbi:hypothetical protein [Acinetobacter pittii]|uniref:Phage protein n=1 Tax=Acinetobacter pittii TaxID=48296 RepID=A0A242SVD9_ACIPI|nr:hypothetical protein [Acinetobacter pittii]AZC00898.1 hypothetical protein DKE52_014315 [Acinetobacter pittii]OTS52437.1 hypothetical protein CAT00_12320 [Acinetobacter pittii]QRF07488.1 hypothetical protein HRJ47_05605 [Acinetobacter pittii]
MSNLSELNKHLFAQLDRLSNNELKGDALKEEVSRAGAVNEICKSVIENANLQLQATKLVAEYRGMKEGAENLPEAFQTTQRTISHG